MGHIANPDREYRLLQQRLDRMVTGAPDSPVFMKILQLLYTPEQAKFAQKIPSRPTPLDELSRRLALPTDELEGKLAEMAGRGLVMDIDFKGRRHFLLSPIVIGFFEFTFMRARDDLPMAELARLFDEYMKEDDRFCREIFQGQTQIGRSLAREEALAGGDGGELSGDHTEILDWERASHIVKTATATGVSLCACRHKASHLGEACDRPLENCLTLNMGVEGLIRNNLAKRITTADALRILEESKEQGLAQTADNVQRQVSYICNCCGCCCGMMMAIKTYDVRNAIVSSNWIMETDPGKCTGCGKCVKACPVLAIRLKKREDVSTEDRGIGDNGSKRKYAVLDESLCLGCGVCYSVCESGAIRLKSRPQRVMVPETMFDRVVTMAIERGKLASLLFDCPERVSHRMLGRVMAVLEKSPPYKAALAIKPLRSAFLNALVKGAQKA